jgi:putative redox protein
MSVRIDSIYKGDLRVAGTHGPSKVGIITDAPVDNHGKGESFSPTDLVATALTHCMATIMGIKAKSLGLPLEGMTLSVEKIMSADAPRRIVKLPVTITVPVATTDEQKRSLIAAAEMCPVSKSLNPEIEKPIVWNWA